MNANTHSMNIKVLPGLFMPSSIAMKTSLSMFCLTLCLAAFARAPWKSDVPDDELKWFDGSQLPLEGRGFSAKTGDLYARLPAELRSAPDLASISNMGHHCTGLNFRFKTDSDLIRIRWSLARNPPYSSLFVPGVACSGLDVYTWFSGYGWRFWVNGIPFARTNTTDVMWVPNRACTVYMPLFNAVDSFSIGIKKDATIVKARPHALGKPVVVYGTSMVNGYNSSRPGMLWTSILGRMIDAEIINQGYSANGKLEESMLKFLGDIDAAAYCFLCCGEQQPIETMRKIYRPFLERLHRRHPETPIVIGEYYWVNGPDAFAFEKPKRNFIADLVAELKESDREFWKNLHIVRMKDMIVADGDGASDYAHLTDLGAKQMATAFANVLRRTLNLD